MAYRRTYYNLETPYSDELSFDLEFSDSEVYDALEDIHNGVPIDSRVSSEDAYNRVKRIYDALVRNSNFLAPSLSKSERLSFFDPEHLLNVYKFSEAITKSGISKELCPHLDHIMVRYYGPGDAAKAEQFLESCDFSFIVETGG